MKKKTEEEKLVNIIEDVLTVINDHYDVDDNHHFLDEFNKAARKRKSNYVAYFGANWEVKVAKVFEEDINE